jgi:TfoX/Sxy family transcriptional regulator of competence genes
MATSAATISHLLDLLSAAGDLSARKMFGEYGLYLDGTIVAFICDDTLFLKPTPGALALLPGVEQGPCYPGSKPYLILTDTLDHPDLAIRALRAVAADAPPPKPKAPKKPKVK